MRVQEITPNLHRKVARCARSTRTVQQALEKGTWAADVGPELTTEMLQEYLALWSRVQTIQLQPDHVDTISWAWEQMTVIPHVRPMTRNSGAGRSFPRQTSLEALVHHCGVGSLHGWPSRIGAGPQIDLLGAAFLTRQPAPCAINIREPCST